MSGTRLFVIGNGFDRHHGIASSYQECATYLARTDRTVYRMVGDYFPVDAEFWAELETRLAEFDADQAVDYASRFLDDKGYDDFQYELEQIGTGLSATLAAHFGDWIRSLVIPERASIGTPLNIDRLRAISASTTRRRSIASTASHAIMSSIHDYAAERHREAHPERHCGLTPLGDAAEVSRGIARRHNKKPITTVFKGADRCFGSTITEVR